MELVCLTNLFKLSQEGLLVQAIEVNLLLPRYRESLEETADELCIVSLEEADGERGECGLAGDDDNVAKGEHQVGADANDIIVEDGFGHLVHPEETLGDAHLHPIDGNPIWKELEGENGCCLKEDFLRPCGEFLNVFGVACHRRMLGIQLQVLTSVSLKHIFPRNAVLTLLTKTLPKTTKIS